MFNTKNLLYFSTNKELGKPEPESETDFVGELHTATEIIAQVEDEEGAQEIVKRVNMHNGLVDFLNHFMLENEMRKNAKLPTNTKTLISLAEQLLKQAEQK